MGRESELGPDLETPITVRSVSRRYFDADSHVLEPSDWFEEYADPSIRARLRPAVVPDGLDVAKIAADVAARADDPDAVLTAFGRGYDSYGAFDSSERKVVLDKFNIDCQLVFSTFALVQFVSDDLELLYGGVRAHTRALVDWCSADPRLRPVPFIPLRDLDRALIELDFALELGCGAVLVPSVAPSLKMGPSHVAIDPFWARLQDADVPFVTHVGTAGRLVPSGYRENGRPLPPDFLGGGENIRSKDFINVGYWPENFLSTLALDGVFERFPRLRAASIEQGAEWVVTMLKKLDGAMQFAKTEPDLAALPMPASDYIRRQVKFTPFPKDDVSWIIDQVGSDLLMFSTDLPHPEGTKDPIAGFEAHLDRFDDSAREKFYVGNMAELLGQASRPSLV